MKILNLNDENFGETVLKSKKPVLVDFWSEWCNPCRFLAPILERVLKDFEDEILFVKVNIDEAPLTADNYQIYQIPTVMIFKEGKPVSFFIGVQKEEAIREWLKENIK
jgi:thioredoxin 1